MKTLPQSSTNQRKFWNIGRQRRAAWILLWAGLVTAWGGARLVSGWFAGLNRIFTEEVTPASGPFYTLEVVTGTLFWLSPFLLVASALLFYQSRAQSPEPSVENAPSVLSPQSSVLKIILPALLLVVVALIHLWPLLQANWPTIAPDYDEGVHMLAARQFVLGFAPHRDFFFTHPPAAIFGLIPAALLGNGGPDTIWLARFTSVVWSVGAAWLVYACGRKLYGWAGGMVALAVFGLDGWGVFIGHQAMLEFQLNFFSLLAFWAFLNYERVQSSKFKVQSSEFRVPSSELKALKEAQNNLPLTQAEEGQGNPAPTKIISDSARPRMGASLIPHLWLILSGAAAGVAFLTRVNGALLLVVLVGYLLLRKRWQATGWLLGAFTVVVLALALPTVLTARGEFFKQVVLFQLLRGADGVAGPKRFEIFAITPQSSLTLICAWLGAFGLLLNAALGRKLPPTLLIVAVWLGISIVLFNFSRAFYLHYYIALLPLLALAAGGLPQLLTFLPEWKQQAGRWLVGVGLTVLLGVSLLGAWQTYGDVGNYPGPQNVGWLVQAQTTPGATLLTMYGFDTFFSDRPLPSTAGHEVLIDHYGAFYYNVYGLGRKSSWDGLAMVFSGFNPARFEPKQILDNPASQNMLVELNARAAYTVVGDFGKGYVSSSTRNAWKSRSLVLFENADIWLYANRDVQK